MGETGRAAQEEGEREPSEEGVCAKDQPEDKGWFWHVTPLLGEYVDKNIHFLLYLFWIAFIVQCHDYNFKTFEVN